VLVQLESGFTNRCVCWIYSQNFSYNFSEVWRRLIRIDTALNVSELILVLIVCIMLVFVAEKLDGKQVAGTTLMSERAFVTFQPKI
jgi:hypothetical protein